MKCLQVDLERMMHDYSKMEESNMQQGVITSLEQTYQDLRKQ